MIITGRADKNRIMLKLIAKIPIDIIIEEEKQLKNKPLGVIRETDKRIING